MEKIIKFSDIKIEKKKFHQRKKPISIKNIDTNKIAISYPIRSLLVKKYLNISLTAKMLKILDLDVYFSKK